MQALKVWAAAINASGGLNGHPVQVIVEDDAGDPATARSEARDLVENKHVVALVDSFAALTIAGWADYMDEKHVPVIGGDCASKVWNEHPMLFPQCPSYPSLTLDQLAMGAKYGKGNNVAILYCVESPDDCGVDYNAYKKYSKALGLNPVYEAQISLAQPDFTGECLQAKQDHVDLLWVAADANTVSRVANSCNRQDYQPQFLQHGITIDANSPSRPGLHNIITAQPTFPFADASSPAIQRFRAAYAHYAPNVQLGPGPAMGWAGASLFEAAALRAGDQITSETLAEALWKMHGETLGGLTVPLTFARNKPAPDARCAFAMVATEGRFSAPGGDKPLCPSAG